MAYDALKQKSTDIIRDHHHNLKHLHHRIKAISPQASLEYMLLKLDDLRNQLNTRLTDRLYNYKDSLSEYKHRIQSITPREKIALEKEKLSQLEKRLFSNRLESTLKRGFVVLKGQKANFIKNTAEALSEKNFTAQFHDGEVAVQVND